MITLLTGAPGTGKTAALVAMLEELGQGRQLYVNGIPDLSIPHEKLDEPDKWPELVPDGAVIIIDEVQRIWRPRGPGQKVPDHVAQLETHRHRGLDVYIITQGPNLVDSNVRALVGRHVHLRDLGILGRWWYEWPECADNCRTAWKNAPIKKRYRLPKRVFSKYKSSSLHVKPIRSVPWMLLVMVVALLGVALLSWQAYGMITAKISPKPLPVTASAIPSTAAPSAQPAPLPAAPQQPAEPIQLAPDERVAFVPRISDRPWTAPAYDDHRRVVTVPYISGALCIKGECVCFASDGSRLPGISSKACGEWLKAPPFNPYVQPPPPTVTASPGIVSAHTPSAPGQNAAVPQQSANAVPMPSGVSNPRADTRETSPFPPGAPFHPTPARDEAGIIPPTLKSPYRQG